MTLLRVALVLLYVAHDVTSYSHGVFTGDQMTAACDAMLPGHSVAANTAASPYTVDLGGVTTWSPLTDLSVTLKSTDGTTTFKGFMLQARKKSDGSRVGKFTPIAGTKNNCGDESAISHDSGALKTSVTFTWMPPTDMMVGDIEFVYTVVQSKPVLWVQLKSGTLTLADGDGAESEEDGNGGGDGDGNGDGGGKSETGGSSTQTAFALGLILMTSLFITLL